MAMHWSSTHLKYRQAAEAGEEAEALRFPAQIARLPTGGSRTR